MKFELKHIWDTSWEIVKFFKPSGQGNTVLVKNTITGEEAVLKILKHQDSEQARRRMFREVNNLQALYDAGCKVPKVIENNVEKFDDTSIELYFIMEKIPGKTLYETVNESKSLSLDDSISLTLDLANTFRIAINEDVLHRDIKPENIMIRSLEKHDVVILDYGLSFNKQRDNDLTQMEETLDNKFLSLPERRVPGGNRRDIRSDLTGLCGIFFYCLTNEFPVDLSDDKGRAPHKRYQGMLKQKINSELLFSFVATFFDQGFTNIIDLRFQTIEELISRLIEIQSPGSKSTEESLEEFAKKTSELMLKHDRKTQVEIYSKNAHEIFNLFPQLSSELERKIYPFTLSLAGIRPVLQTSLQGEKLGNSVSFIIRERHHENNRLVNYDIRADGLLCVVYRSKSIMKNRKEFIVLENWLPIYRFDGFTKPEKMIIKKDVEASILEAMKIIQREILEGIENNKIGN